MSRILVVEIRDCEDCIFSECAGFCRLISEDCPDCGVHDKCPLPKWESAPCFGPGLNFAKQG